MCAIVDAQVAHEVFGEAPSPAGREFYRWLHKGRGHLVTGGKLQEELEGGSPGFRKWAREAGLAGLMTVVNKAKVEERTIELERDAKHTSNDPHVLAVAQMSGARLLFTNDRRLEEDFGNKLLIDGPRGCVYHTRDIAIPDDNKQFKRAHKRLLSNRRLCRTQRRRRRP